MPTATEVVSNLWEHCDRHKIYSWYLANTLAEHIQ